MALYKVFAYIRDGQIEHPTVAPSTDLTSKLVTEMAECGVIQVAPSTKKHLRRKVEAEFGESLHIIPNDKGKLLVYPDNLTMDELVKVCQKLKDELKEHKSSISEDIISHIHLEMMNSTHTSLVEFLQTLLTGSSKVGNNPSQRVQRLTASFSQDLVYAVTCGKVKPTKHIVLPFAVKSLTGNVELIKILNRLGHGVSYSQLEEIDTAFAFRSKQQVEMPSHYNKTSSLVCLQHWRGTI